MLIQEIIGDGGSLDWNTFEKIFNQNQYDEILYPVECPSIQEMIDEFGLFNFNLILRIYGERCVDAICEYFSDSIKDMNSILEIAYNGIYTNYLDSSIDIDEYDLKGLIKKKQLREFCKKINKIF